MGRLQAALVKQLGELGAAAERSVQSELQAFMQLGLPAIQHILSDNSSFVEKAGDAEAHAAAAARVKAVAADAQSGVWMERHTPRAATENTAPEEFTTASSRGGVGGAWGSAQRQ